MSLGVRVNPLQRNVVPISTPDRLFGALSRCVHVNPGRLYGDVVGNCSRF